MASGKRAGSRRGSRPPRKTNRGVLLLGVGVTLCVIAWGYLVYAAIDFGTAARGASAASAWLFMGLASLGAIACLFIGLLLVTRMLVALGISRDDDSDPDDEPRPTGGRRAAR